jgi:hypothetical protein
MTLFSWALMLALAVQTAQSEPLPVQELRQAWSEGQVSQANMHAMTALEALEERGCAVSPLAASLLFYAAVSDQACQCNEVWGYSFWAALAVDERVGGLTETQREIARQFASPPGADRTNDWAFARSPYLGSRMEQQGMCETLEPLTLAGPGRGEGQAAFLYTRIRTRPNDRVYRTLPVMSYPEAETADMSEHLVGYRDYTEERNEILFYRFTPCRWMNNVEGGQAQLCRSDWLEGEISAP